MVGHDVAEAKKTSDHVIVSFHWGEERTGLPKPYQEDLARFCVDQGASLVVGPHPHVPQTVEIYRGKAIVYSVGNFAFGSSSPNSSLGLLAEAVLAKTAVERVRLHGLDVHIPRTNFKIIPMPEEQARPLLEALVPAEGPDHRAVWNSVTGSLDVIFAVEP